MYSGRAYLDLYTLQSFQSSLTVLTQKLIGVATLFPLEDQFTVRLAGDGKGHIAVTGHVFEEAAYGSCLKYEFGIAKHIYRAYFHQ
ncbi:hypothetical protein [Pseudoalteromonas ruthenica]|uniref:hypothetical protein n=1 Tax=Pseudoalteromonas ruthenica TaxID=151081 RepID=UPI003D2C41F2